MVAIDPTLHHCPTPDCPYLVSWRGVKQDGPPECDCPVCKQKYCLACLAKPYHKGLNCLEYKAKMEKEKMWAEDSKDADKAEKMT